ncbi:nuclear transport factor 2 family protein [Parathermosynechococcus lividus]|uniref:nuclear transport factor 2 family protein n=1 Tax=Parathermosynechococcus lividus TaxID=33070 RepID=UPI000C18A070|nr:nuclear transport factor 2 family protein [Thermostichus lividus]
MRRGLLVPLIGLTVLLGAGHSQSWAAPTAQATTAVPESVQAVVTGLDSAASQKNIDAVMAFYDPSFSTPDGLTAQILRQQLPLFWQPYAEIRYSTRVDRWQQQGEDWVVEVTTTIDGKGGSGDRPQTIRGTLQATQTIRNGKILRQDITSEKTTISIGSTPPTVQFSLPQQVRPGEDFTLDAIVQEPIGNAILLGAASDQPINAQTYTNPGPVKLELLAAGGIFKVGRAPQQPGNRWISVALIRDTGMVLITQRLRVGNP